MSNSRKKNEKKFLLSLQNLAKGQNSEITQHEICGKYIIGIDETKKFVFFQLKSHEVFKENFIDLSTIKNCKIVNISSATSNNNKVIEQLSLSFSPINKSKTNIILEFYNTELSTQLNGEFQSIEKWNTLINKNLDSKK